MDAMQSVLNLNDQSRGEKDAIVIPKWILRLVNNDLIVAMFLKQCVYLDSHFNNPQGFFQTYPQWQADSGLTRYQVDNALKTINQLAARDVITTLVLYVNGANRKHYKVQWEALYAWFCEKQPNVLRKTAEPSAENNTTSCEKQPNILNRSTNKSPQTEEDKLHSLPPVETSPAFPMATNEDPKIVPFAQVDLSEDEKMVDAICDLCALVGNNQRKRARRTLRKLRDLTHPEYPPEANDFIRFRYYMKAVNARPTPPTLAYLEDGWQSFLDWLHDPYNWTVGYWEKRGWPKGVSRSELVSAHDRMEYNPALMVQGGTK